jgi:hypothetical protein
MKNVPQPARKKVFPQKYQRFKEKSMKENILTLKITSIKAKKLLRNPKNLLRKF